ncbi:hypothetical protein [Synechococcus sp. CCY 9618]|uniref:DUF7219 family protein n=1 Tax=Synechococcus sp. CCY 9618 TaxID=2815602 RepID=UPI0020B3F5E9|nr:hypothetical protein [Synechococcus sp. CCY 9618]
MDASSGANNRELSSPDREVRSPMEAHGSYRGNDWSPERLMFHQNLESFADQVGLIVGLQANGKMSQEDAWRQIKKIWKNLKFAKDSLLENPRD